MVLLYAVPLALFVGTVSTPRADLVQDIALVVAIFTAIVGLYALVFLLFRPRAARRHAAQRAGGARLPVAHDD